VGVGTKSGLCLDTKQLNEIMERGMAWAVEQGLAWSEDAEATEGRGCIPGADPRKVSQKARGRANQLGTLGSGNHYVEVQAVEEIFDAEAAAAMGIVRPGQVCVMIHCGSRGFGHQIASDFVNRMSEHCQGALTLNDPQLACVPAASALGRDYLACMAAAANFAFVNRTVIAGEVRKAFEAVTGQTAREQLDMHQVYDVAHNIASIEEHECNGATGDAQSRRKRRLLVHRKGSTRAFPPGHPELPKAYQACGQPVLIGGSMGTWSYVMVGTETAMRRSFGSTCHGAGRALSRSASRAKLSAEEVLARLQAQGISIRLSSPDLISEEAPESYKDVQEVVEVCHCVGISRKVVKLRPLAVIKG
jgi:tRNA-splicing ligase RtcB